MLAWLDEKGRLQRDPLRARGAGDGFPTAIVLDPKANPIRGILSRSGHYELTLDTLEVAPDGSSRTFPLLTLDGPPSLDVSLALLDGASPTRDGGQSLVFYNDDGPDAGARRARSIALAWIP